VASHDLQEPLRKVLTFSNLLEGELNGSASPDAQLYLQKIALSASRMQRLIQDILQFSRLAQPEDFKKTNLGEVVHQAVADAEVRITETGAKVDFGSLPIIEAVPSQMGQLFANLLSNALKYAKPGQQPHVHIRADEISGADLSEEEIRNLAYYDASRSPTDWAAVRFSRIYVRDEGIGFEAEYAAKIFAIFQRLHGRDAYDGTGIGLAVSKKIVENHHGLIEARSTPGEGATFIITLPVSQESFSNMLTEAADATLEAA
jgi:light-regulated signal transduction histidine kinase (bacteriophytochrome)